jgi:hypothetical protein
MAVTIHGCTLYTDFDKYTEDAIALFTQSGVNTVFENLEDGVFFGGGGAKDPIVGSNGEGDSFTVPRRPVRRRLQGLPRFVVTRGGAYGFLPGRRALRWLADLET